MIFRGLAFAGVWLSPAVLLAVEPALLADGGRGPWAPAVLAGAACLVAVALAPPWSRLRGARTATLRDLARHRWPDARLSLVPLTLASSGSALLFLWAQLAAGRELAHAAGWPTWAAVATGLAVLAVAVWRDDVAGFLAALGGALAVVGALIPLGAVAAATDPVWPRVWDAVASRPKVTFSSEGRWTREGWPVRGGGAEVAITAAEEQRVTLLDRGQTRLELWEGGGGTREVSPGTELTLRPGDRLVLREGFRVRFQAGRAIPGAPASGADWLSPPRRPEAWRDLAGLGFTLLMGALGLAPVHAALPSSGAGSGARAARVGAALAVLGLVAAVFWSLYAAWLIPEAYTGGVTGSEVYELPAHVDALRAMRIPLADLATLGLVGGGIAGIVLSLRAVPLDPALGAARSAGPVVVALAALGCAILARIHAWPVAVAAFGLAGSVAAPAAVLACWRERLHARAVAAGAGLGLVVFTGLSILAVSGLPPGPESSWLAWLTAWPAVPAASLNVLIVWALSAGRAASPRSPLPPELADLHA